MKIFTNVHFPYLAVLLCSASALCTPAFAEVHKWKDAEGKVHYGDVPEVRETTVIKADPLNADHRANANRLRSETSRVMNDVAKENATYEQNRKRQAYEAQQQSAQEQRAEAQRMRELNRRR